MIVAATVAVVGFLLIAAASQAGDGRGETAIAIPLAATVAVWNGYAALAVLAGAGLAYAALAALESRTLLFGRRLRAIAAVAGAVVPLSALAAATLLGNGWPHPEVWLVGSVVPGVLAYDLRRQPPRRRGPVAIGGAMVLASLAFAGIVLRATLTPSALDLSLLAPDAVAPEPSLLALAPLVLGAVALAAWTRWRYGLHVGVVTVPLLAVWAVGSPTVLAAYAAAGVVAVVALRWLRALPPLHGRQLAATGAAGGTLVGAVVAALGAPALPALLAGALAAEDVRLLDSHVGADLVDAVGLTVGLFAALATLVGLVTGADSTALAVGGVVAVLSGGNAARIVLRRELARPAEGELEPAERRWVP